MKQQTIQKRKLKERNEYRVKSIDMLKCESCNSFVDTLLTVNVVIPNRINPKAEQKKMCFHCVRTYKLYIQWKGIFWKTIVFNL